MMPRHELASILQKHLNLPPAAHPRIFKAVDRLPRLKVSVSDVSAVGLQVNLHRLNPLQDPQARIFAPRYPKPQSEGYFVVVSDPTSNEILGLKRVGWNVDQKHQKGRTGGGGGGGRSGESSSGLSARAVIKVPQGATRARKVRVEVVSDCYVGMEWVVEGDVEIPVAPAVGDEGKTKGEA